MFNVCPKRLQGPAIAIVLLGAGSINAPADLHAANDDMTQYHCAYFKQEIPLQLDPGRLAILRQPVDKAGDLSPVLKPLGIQGPDVTPGPDAGWSFVNMPSPENHDAGIKHLISRIAVDAKAVAFASPVFVDEYGPVVITPELLVGFDEHVTAGQAEAILQAAGAGRIIDVDYARMKNVYRVRSDSRNGFDVLAIANALARRAEVKFAEPNMIRTAKLAELIPNDPLFPRQWHLHNTGQNVVEGWSELCCAHPCTGPCWPACPELCLSAGFPYPCNDYPAGPPDFDLDAPEAWDMTTGVPSVIIVVFDSGIQLDHADLLIDPSLGMDCTGQGGGGFPVQPCDFHGTVVAGTIRAQINNEIGVAGLAPQCSLASARVLRSTSTSNPCGNSASWQTTCMIAALDWAQGIGARITNHSYTISPSSALTAKFAETRAAGIIHFAAAGNCGCSTIGYPANLPTVNAISGLDLSGSFWSSSSYGNGIDFAAPTFPIFTTDIEGNQSVGYYAEPTCNDYAPGGGTSFASPLAAGVAALILSIDPSLSPEGVEQIMRDSAVDLGPPGYDIQYGWGMVNAYNAVTLAVPVPGDMNCDHSVNGRDIGAFALALLDPAAYQAAYPACSILRADVNGDTVLNELDIAPFVTCLINGGCP